jgi:acyl-CoA synthetase (AMP-forming)/AMP-acid ligase II
MKMGMVGLYFPKFDAGEWLRIVARERPTMAFLVPAMAELLVAHPDFATADLDSLQAVSIGSAPLAPNTLMTLVERLPQASVSNSYGMTEAGPAFIVMPQEEVTKRIGSVGKPTPPRAPGHVTVGCGAATSGTSTTTASCTSSGARRISSSGADTTCTRRISRA